jgi:hypothetical protein
MSRTISTTDTDPVTQFKNSKLIASMRQYCVDHSISEEDVVVRLYANGIRINVRSLNHAALPELHFKYMIDGMYDLDGVRLHGNRVTCLSTSSTAEY